MAVVPAPPWWITAETRGKSQSCGQLSRKRMLSEGLVEVRPPQPFEMRARSLKSFSAVRRRVVRESGSGMTMEPKPM